VKRVWPILAALAWWLAPVCSGGPAAALGAEDPCLECHGLAGLAVDGRSFWVHGVTYAGSVHGRLSCGDCHKGVVGYPHEPGQRVRCDLLCHVAGASHEAQSRAVAAGPHAGLVDPPCLACHTGNAPPARPQAEGGCASCHGALAAERIRYPDTPGAFGFWGHRRSGEEGRMPTCATCHGVHEVHTGPAAREACAAEACHPGAGAAFGELFDHRGSPERPAWGGAIGVATLLGAAVGVFLLCHAWRGEA